jgi:2,4-dienoyl-CoA reductase-like NADH-dependent reductase (Old Yellow Enzyme family)/thioredoxin reductase
MLLSPRLATVEGVTATAMRFPRLFEPIRIGPRTARNRVMRLATVTNLAENARVGDRMLAHYAAVARGGAGTIVVEALRVHPSDPARPTFIPLFDPDVVPSFRRLADAVHAEGALLLAQLYHGGRQHLARLVPTMWAPSAIACPYSGGVPHEMTTAEVKDVIQGFLRSAVHACEAGADGVEVHGAQGHLIQQFLSPFSNRRTDEYGGSPDNRLRFAREIIAGIRERLGRDAVVGYRMGVEEFTPGGLTLEDSVLVARRLVGEGLLDYLSLSQGNFNSIDRHLPDRHSPPATFVDRQARIKAEASTLPVVASGRIETPEQAEAILASGKADIIGLCRPLIVDPDWPRKAMEGRTGDIRYCIACNQCWGWVIEGRPIGCVCNATAGRESELGPLTRAAVARRVVIAGGGPAGLEAARVAAERGHHVTILEQSNALGGKVRLTEHVPHDEEMRRVIDFLTGQIARLGVAVRLETEATPATVAAERPDAVIVATGAVPMAPVVPGDDSVPVSTSAASLLVGTLPGEHVVVMDEDGYYWAAAVIETVAAQGKKVTVVTRFFEVLRELPAVSRISALRALDEQGVTFRPHIYVDRVEAGAVVLKDCYTGREEQIAKASAVIWVGPQEAKGALAEDLRAAGLGDIRVVGDAFAPRRLANAIEEGHRAGRAV